MSRPKPNSQAGRLLAELEAAHSCGNVYGCRDESCGRLSLIRILNLHPPISQHAARIHELRHRFLFQIHNDGEEGHSERRYFRLHGRDVVDQGHRQPAANSGRLSEWEKQELLTRRIAVPLLMGVPR